MERKEFENNNVLLWGEKQAKKSLLEEFDKGNKNPHSLLRKKAKPEEKEKPEKKAPIKRVFSLDEDYGPQDLPFLNKEYDRIEKEITNKGGWDDDLIELQDKLNDLIEGLEAMKKMTGGRVKYEEEQKDLEEIHELMPKIIEKMIKLTGKGFKKGSPEALAHAKKMREALEAKKGPKVEKVVHKSVSKARVEKGSEEAKALGRRLAEAKKKKAEEKKAEAPKVEEVKKPKRGKPWFYIGDIPKGYREATEDEAIQAKKVSLYGKYQVDNEKWRLYKEYGILLTEDKTNQEITWTMNGLKKRTLEILEEIEIISSKLENDKYKNKWNTYKLELEDLKEKRKYLQAGYNWYYKLLCGRTGKEYKRQKIELEKREIIPSSERVEYKPPVRPIDPRTGKEAEYIFPTEEKKKKEEKKFKDVDLLFEKNGDIITLSTKYFTQDYKLKPSYAKKLTAKNIFLKKKHYTTDDYNKYFYGMKGGNTGYGLLEN